MLSNEPMCLELLRATPRFPGGLFQCSLTSRCVWNRLVQQPARLVEQVSMLSNEPMCLEFWHLPRPYPVEGFNAL